MLFTGATLAAVPRPRVCKRRARALQSRRSARRCGVHPAAPRPQRNANRSGSKAEATVAN